MSDQQQTATVVANDGPAQDAVAAAVLATQMAIIDQAVRTARIQGWCGQFEEVMRGLFPDGPPDGSADFVDSDGWSCRGYNREGYNEQGFNAEGYDREGFTRDGRDAEGYDRNGYNRYGWTREGRDREGRSLTDPAIRAEYRYDRYGYDREGYNDRGMDRTGRTREWYAERNQDGFMYRLETNQWGERLLIHLTTGEERYI